MKKIKLLRYCIIAAGIAISAAFYIISGASDADYSLYVDAEDTFGTEEGTSSGDSERGAESVPAGGTGGSGGLSDPSSVNAAAGISDTAAAAFTSEASEAGISDELRDELKDLIREAVREELVAVCDEGYLEAALDKAAEYSAEEAERRKGLVNINTADKQELMTLAGIGEKRADDIIAYRQQHGNFAEPSDIMKVSGIKASSFEKICDKICT